MLPELIDGSVILLGVGMNADAGADDLPETDGLPPTSLRLEGARAATPAELAALLVAELRPLSARFDEGGFDAVRDEADELDALRGLELELAVRRRRLRLGHRPGLRDRWRAPARDAGRRPSSIGRASLPAYTTASLPQSQP